MPLNEISAFEATPTVRHILDAVKGRNPVNTYSMRDLPSLLVPVPRFDPDNYANHPDQPADNGEGSGDFPQIPITQLPVHSSRLQKCSSW